MRLPNSILSLCWTVTLISCLGCSLGEIEAQTGAQTPGVQLSTTQTPQVQTPGAAVETPALKAAGENQEKEKKMEVATFGAGCFWCVEAVFQELKGVGSVKSGYMGGQVENPTYEQVCTGRTGHAEVIQIEYDPEVISFDVLLQVFWKTHDPTTLNQQGADKGTQYRSAVFYHNQSQQEKAASYKKKLNEVKAFPNPIVTEISAASTFYAAIDYHQDYFKNNPNQRYCKALIPPKLEKLRQAFGDKLKTD